MTVQQAVKRGVLIKAPCEVCGEAKVDAHHDDYTKPLSVRWLCRKHHKAVHTHMKRNGQKPIGYDSHAALQLQVNFKRRELPLLIWLKDRAKMKHRGNMTTTAITILAAAKAAEEKQKEPSNENNQG